jgi:hypothetical protein
MHIFALSKLYVNNIFHILFQNHVDIYLFFSRMTKIQDRLWRSVGTLEYFTSNQWVFSNQNVLDLYKKLYAEDQEVSRHLHVNPQPAVKIWLILVLSCLDTVDPRKEQYLLGVLAFKSKLLAIKVF